MKEKLNLYRILAVLFFVIAGCLAYVNLGLIEREESINVVSSKALLPKDVEQEKKYGYTDMLQLIAFEENFEIQAMESNSDNRNSIKVEMDYAGDAESFLHSLDRLKKQECILSIENIRIVNGAGGVQSITMTAVFLRNK